MRIVVRFTFVSRLLPLGLTAYPRGCTRHVVVPIGSAHISWDRSFSGISLKVGTLKLLQLRNKNLGARPLFETEVIVFR
jgi:hypothetical protein